MDIYGVCVCVCVYIYIYIYIVTGETETKTQELCTYKLICSNSMALTAETEKLTMPSD